MTRWDDPAGKYPTERRCTATNRSGQQCGKYAIRGGSVCTAHGGRNPSVKRRAEQNLAVEEARADAAAALGHHGLTPVDDPVIELGKVAREIVAMKDALAARVNALSGPTYAAMGEEKPRVELALYERALDRTVKVLDLLGRHDLEARRVRVEEQTARLFMFVLRGVFLDLDLSADQHERSSQVAQKWVGKALEGVAPGDLPQNFER